MVEIGLSNIDMEIVRSSINRIKPEVKIVIITPVGYFLS